VLENKTFQMGKRIGVIDLGSNTFHLLIVEKENGQYSTIHKERSFVGLAEEGIGKISENSFRKGIDALVHFKELLTKHNTTDYRVIGTAALRSASNSQDFIQKIKHDLDMSIEIIEGEREAELIFKGVNQIAETKNDNHVIMDVGGGSVEFILIEKGEMTWMKSYNIGVGVLHNSFHKSDPISKEALKELDQKLDDELLELKAIVKEKKIKSLIGASGSFEVVQSMNDLPILNNAITEVSLDKYDKVSETILSSTTREREQMDGLPASRVKLIVVAMVLIDKAIEIIKPEILSISPYALKEGLLSEIE